MHVSDRVSGLLVGTFNKIKKIIKVLGTHVYLYLIYNWNDLKKLKAINHTQFFISMINILLKIYKKYLKFAKSLFI